MERILQWKIRAIENQTGWSVNPEIPQPVEEIHVHVDASNITVEFILAQLGDAPVDHPNAYASQKLNKEKRNYLTTKWERLGMIFSLQKFRHYFLDNPFVFYTHYQELK
jgi:hypothetical protein